MSTFDYVNSDQFERDWKHAKAEVQRVIKPLLTDADDRLRFSATINKKSQIAWIEIREPHPALRLIAVTLPRNVEPLTLRITAWFYEEATEPYQRWCETALPGSMPLTPVNTTRNPSGSWKNSPALKDNDISVIGVEHACRKVSFTDEVSLTEFLVPLLKPYIKQLLSVLNGAAKTYRLLGPDGEFYQSPLKGTLGGNSKEKRYGELECSAANRALDKGYAGHRVFFANESEAIAAGYKPCGACMRKEYAKWKAGGVPDTSSYPWKVLPK
ncbi:hypothetical protein [Motiliproteus sp. SC1-56]|uniref:hypothetical protein n=1 Tax=Motiliproteus sp. SC1-56 TaxID=2799565 RepID=UPI001F5C5813|nr:hypothetical protein [Motiliproteus sp. SC1-56]